MTTTFGQRAGARFAEAIAKYPLRFGVLALLLVVACVAGARLLHPDFTYRAFFREDDPLRVQVERFDATFGSDDSIVLIVHNPKGIVNPDTADLLVSLTEAMWLVPDIVRVESLSNFRYVRAAGDDILVDAMIPDEGLRDPALLAARRAAIAADRLIPDYLLSGDGTTTMIVGYVRETAEHSPDPGPIVAGVREMIAAHEASGHEFHITGRIAIMAGMQESAQADAQRTLPLVLLALVVLLALGTRRFAGVIGPVLLVAMGIAATMGASGWMGMSISNITAMVPQFILAITVATAVHVLMAFFRRRRQGADRRPAVQGALAETFVPTLLASITTAAAFLSFLATDITAIGNLGAMVGVGVMLSWFLTFTFLGAFLALVPPLYRRRRPAVATAGADAMAEEVGCPYAPAFSERYDRFVTGLVRHIALHKVHIAVLAVVIAVAAVAPSLHNTINANPFRYFDKDFWLRQSADFSEDHLRGAQGIEVVVDTGQVDGVKDPAFLRRVEAFQTWLDGQDYVVKTVSILDFLKQANRALHGDDDAYYVLPETQQETAELLFLYGVNLPEGMDLSNRVSRDADKMRISVRWTLYDSAQATRQAVVLEEKAASMGLKVETTGKMLLFQRMNGYVAESLFISLGLSLVLVSVVLMLVFRSTSFGVVSLIVNVVPLGVGVAALSLAGRDIDTGAVVALAVCLGVVVDDTIHLLQAIREADGRTMRESIVVAMNRVLPAITLTTAALVIGFGAFMLGDFVPNQNFGLLAIVILLAAYVFDVVVLPALLLLTARRPGAAAETEPQQVETPA